MSRTNEDNVMGIMSNEYDIEETPSLIPFIDTASSMVDDLVECAAEKGVVLSDSKLELIERWLSAHFYSQSDKPYTESETIEARAKYNGQTKMYLESTLYGQTAVKLDPTGCLAAIAGEEDKSAGVIWMGKRPSEQVPWYSRQ